MNSVPLDLDPVGRLETRLARIEAQLDELVRALEDSTPTSADGDARDPLRASTQSQHASHLLETLSEPRYAQAVERLVRRLPDLEPLADLAAAFEPTTAMLFDMLDEQVDAWKREGIDPEARFFQAASLLRRLTDPAIHQAVEELLDALPALTAATRAIPPAEPVGLFALLRALSDPEVRRAVGLAVAVARGIGRTLPATTLTRS